MRGSSRLACSMTTGSAVAGKGARKFWTVASTMVHALVYVTALAAANHGGVAEQLAVAVLPGIGAQDCLQLC